MLAVYRPLHTEYPTCIVELVNVQWPMTWIRRAGYCSTGQFCGGCRDYLITGVCLETGQDEVVMLRCREGHLYRSAEPDNVGCKHEVEPIRAISADSFID